MARAKNHESEIKIILDLRQHYTFEPSFGAYLFEGKERKDHSCSSIRITAQLLMCDSKKIKDIDTVELNLECEAESKTGFFGSVNKQKEILDGYVYLNQHDFIYVYQLITNKQVEAIVLTCAEFHYGAASVTALYIEPTYDQKDWL